MGWVQDASQNGAKPQHIPSKNRIKIRFHLKKVKKLVIRISYMHRGKKGVNSDKKRLYCDLINRVEHAAKALLQIINKGRTILDPLLVHYSNLTIKVIEQAKQRVIEGKSVNNEDKIFSIYEEHTQLIKRGKAGKNIEFGHRVTIGQSKEKFITYCDIDERHFPEYLHIDLALSYHHNVFGKHPKGFAVKSRGPKEY